MNASRLAPFVPLALGLLSCGASPRRDLSTIPQRQITFDDMCRLQDYFDQRNAANAPPFRTPDESSTETQRSEPDEHGRMRRVQLGEGTYIVSDARAKHRLARLLNDDYLRLPTLHLGREDGDVRIHVGWWASGEMRRLRPDTDIQITTTHETVSVPFDPCVGEFLFGATVYALRRHVLDSDRARANGEEPPGLVTDVDAGSVTMAESTGPADAGVADGD